MSAPTEPVDRGAFSGLDKVMDETKFTLRQSVLEARIGHLLLVAGVASTLIAIEKNTRPTE